jgi:phospholipid/cholesterol/gamma-HCH transport system substrate-binding protein
MKLAKGNSIKLGIFVSITLVILIAAIYLIGQKKQLFGSTFRISSVFKDVSGLQAGNNVRFTGINVGIVDGMEQISDTTLKVYMLIDAKSQAFIKKNARAIIGSDGLMGNKIVIITPGASSKKEIQDNDVIESATPINIDDILLKLQVTIENASAITDDMAAITHNMREGKGTIGKLFMDSTLADNVGQAIQNIKQGAGGFQQNMKAASKSIFLRRFFKKKKPANS